jgi:hypothetical protein
MRQREQCDVEGARGVREAVGRQDADRGGLQRELHLRLVGVPRRERHGQDVPGQKVRAPARNLVHSHAVLACFSPLHTPQMISTPQLLQLPSFDWFGR